MFGCSCLWVQVKINTEKHTLNVLAHTAVAVFGSLASALCTNIFKAGVIYEIPGEGLRHA